MKKASITLCLLLLGCRESPVPVNESYGSVNNKSINGFDLMREHLQSNYDVQTSSFLDTKKMSQYDLIIYVQTELAHSEYMIELDRKIAEMVRPPEAPAEAIQESEVTPSDDSEGTAEEAEDVRRRTGVTSEGERPIALLIFQRGTTASGAFWSRQWAALSADQKRVRDFVADRISAGKIPEWLPESSLFFKRKLLDEKPFEKRVYYNRAEQASYRGRELPARIPAGLSILSDDPDHIPVEYRRSIAAFTEGSFYIEATIPGAYLFLVSDSAPFLNYHLIRESQIALLDFVVDRAMKYRPIDTGKKPKILILDHFLTREERIKEERSLSAMFLQPPWNLYAALLIMLFVLFVWSRLLRDRPITEIEPESSEGDLMRHFEGVGRRISAIADRNRKSGGKQ